jgi:MoxR-like ATPase
MTAKTKTPAPVATDERIRRIIKELGDQFYERRPHLEAIWIGLLAGVNTYFLGEPGTAKSLMVRESSARVTTQDPNEHLYW